jgi:hypothetical protein
MPMKKGVIALNSSDFPLLKDGLVIKAKMCCYITWLSIKAQGFNPQLHKFLGFHLTPLGLWLILPVIHILSFTGFFLVAVVCPFVYRVVHVKHLHLLSVWNWCSLGTRVQALGRFKIVHKMWSQPCLQEVSFWGRM